MRTLMLAAFLAVAAAGAADAAVPPGDYGGGRIIGGKPSRGDSWMWVRVLADGRARVGGAVRVPCGLVRFDAVVTPAADGTFEFTRVRRVRTGGDRLRAVATVSGGFDGDSAVYGEVYGRLRIRRPSGRVVLCTTGNSKPWSVRRPPTEVTPGMPLPLTTYLGLTNQAATVPRPFLLRVPRGAQRVAFAIFEYTRRCTRRSYFLNEITGDAPIRPDGTFSIRGRFTLRYDDVPQVERFRVHVDGAFGAGVVTGSLRVTSVARRRGSGRVVDRCDTGPVTFAARP
jgi:hypothetical protein